MKGLPGFRKFPLEVCHLLVEGGKPHVDFQRLPPPVLKPGSKLVFILL